MTDKASALKTVDAEYRNLLKAIDGLDDTAMARVWFGAWSAKDVIAHVMGWEREMTGALERIARGERPTPEGVDYSDSDAWNAKFAAGYHGISSRTVIADWQQAHQGYVKAAQAIPGDRYGEKDGKLATVNRLLQTSGSGHYKEHAPQILEWRKSQGI
jgi:hypothetical protein